MKLTELKKELEKKPKFINEYDKLQPEYEIVKAILKARKDLKMTQKQLAEKTGIDRSDISKLENGLTNPSLMTLNRVAKALDMELHIEFKKKYNK